MYGTILLAACAGIIVWSILVALIRGVSKAKIRFITVIIAAVLALGVTVVMKIMFGQQSVVDMIMSLFKQINMEQIEELIADSPVLKEIVLKSTVGLLAPFVFMLVFVLICLVTWLIFILIVLLSFGRFRKKDKTKHLKGIRCLIMGAIQGIIITAVLMLPVMMYLEVIPDVMPELEASDALDENTKEMLETVKEPVDELNASPVTVMYRNLGGKLVYTKLSSYNVKYNDETIEVNLLNEAKPLTRFFLRVMEISKTNMEEFGEAEAEVILELGNSFADSKLLTALSAELIRNATDAWLEGNTFVGIAKPEMGELVGPLFDSVLGILNESSASIETLGEDVVTVSRLLSNMAKAGIFAKLGDQDALIDALGKEGVIASMTSVLSENQRLKRLIPEITNLGIRAMASGFGIPENGEEVYLDLMDSVADAIKKNKDLDTPERIEELKNDLDTELGKAGVEIDPEYIDIIATALIEDFGDFDGEVTPEFIAEFFTAFANKGSGEDETTDVSASGSYSIVKLGETNNGYTYPKYAESIENSGAFKAAKATEEIKVILESDKTEEEKKNAISLKLDEVMGDVYENLCNMSEDKAAAAAYLSGMTDKIAETASKKTEAGMSASNLADIGSGNFDVFKCVTLEKICVGTDFDITDIEKEAKAIENIIKSASDLIVRLSSSEEEIEIKELTKAIGEILDSLSETQMFGGERTSELLKALLGSEQIKDLAKSSSIDIDILIEKIGDCSYSSIMKAIGETISVVEEMSENGGAEKTSIEELIESIDTDNAAVIGSLVNSETMEKIGIDSENSEKAAEVIGTLFENLGAVDGEAKEDEAEAVKQLLDIGMSVTGNKGDGNVFGNTGSTGYTAETIVETVMSSTAVKETINAVIGGETGKSDPFGIGASMSENDVSAIIDACNSYSAGVPSGKKAETDEVLASIAAMFGIEWTAGAVK